jgi:hypothetical protein
LKLPDVRVVGRDSKSAPRHSDTRAAPHREPVLWHVGARRGWMAAMPFTHYGVLVGSLTSHFRDDPDDQGRWYHLHLTVNAGGSTYEAAIDVDSHASATGVEWKRLTVPVSAIGPVGAFAAGWHPLGRSQDDGALDHLRHPSFLPSPGCLFVTAPPAWVGALLQRLNAAKHWVQGSYLEASVALEEILAVGRQTFVWGEPFTQGLGVHNVHQNQGDPKGTGPQAEKWWAENGIWQDGGVMTLRPDGQLDVFISKFTSQAYRTDADGHPA